MTVEGERPSSQNSAGADHLGGLLPIRRIRWHKIALFIASLMLFMLALELMKAGTCGIASFTNDVLHVEDPMSGLGFGWLSSYLVLSGSPVAAMALALLDAGTIGPYATFAMIVGSRVGGSLIVVLIGVIYTLRGHEKGTSLLVGLLALIITVTIYVFALPLGLATLNLSLATVRIRLPIEGGLASLIDVVFGPPVRMVTASLPDWGVFLLGLGATVLSLNMIDRALPELDLEEHVFGRVSRLLYRPAISFVLGTVLTLLTMSVSVSLGLLVPLSVRGYVRRENLVPYIMGCNISTFVDTLIAGILLRNPMATDVVLTQMISILIVSLVVLAFLYRAYERVTLDVALWLNQRRGRMIVFFALILLIPVVLMAVGSLAGRP
jgi:Na+/phosphate symporter